MYQEGCQNLTLKKWRVEYFLACFIVTFHAVAGQSPKYALLGERVHLNPGLKTSPDDILWKHNGDKVVEFNGNEELVYNPFENRVTLDWHSGELDITDLRYEDSGDYELEVYTNKGLSRSNFKLEVIGTVAKPTISCEMNDGSNSNKSGNQATLTCSVEPGQSQSLMKFEWSLHGNMQSGQKLTISLGDEHDDKVYTCTVSNPLTTEMATFTAKDCYTDRGSAALTAGISVTVAIVFAVLLGLVFCKLKHKACFAKENRDDMEMQQARKTKGSENGDEHAPFLDRAPTLPSHQLLSHLSQSSMKKNDSVRYYQEETKRDQDSGRGLEKDARRLPQDYISKEDDNVEQLGQPTEEKDSEFDNSDSEKSKDVLPSVSDNHSEETQSHLQTVTASEQPESEKEVEDEGEGLKSAHANDDPVPAAQLYSPLTPNSPNRAPNDGLFEQEEDTNSEQVPQEPRTKTVGESDSGGLEEGKESGSLSEEKESPTDEHKGEETTAQEQNSKLTEMETHSERENQQDSDKQLSEDESEGESNGADGQEENDKTESSVISKPDNHSTFLDPNDAAHAVLDQEEKDKTRHNSQSESSTEGADKGEAAEDKNEEPKRACEHEEDANSNQATVDPTEKIAGESGSDLKERKELDILSQKKQSPTPEYRGEEPTVKETHLREDSQQEGDEQGNEGESNNSGDQEDIDMGKNVPLDTSQQPLSPMTSKGDNYNIDTFPESNDAAHAVLDQEEKDKTRHNSQSESSTEGADKGEAAEDKNEEPKRACEHEEDANSNQATVDPTEKIAGESDSDLKERVRHLK